MPRSLADRQTPLSPFPPPRPEISVGGVGIGDFALLVQSPLELVGKEPKQ